MSVRSRLLLAFSILFISAMALAAVGWWGMRGTRDALRDFRSHVLPDIARSLELAQRTTLLAAMAPYVAEANQPFLLQTEAEALRARLREAAKLADALPQADSEEFDLRPVLATLNHTIEALIEVTQSDLFLREDLRQHLYSLRRAREEISLGRADEQVVEALYSDLLLASSVDDLQLSLTLKNRVVRQLDELGRGRNNTVHFLNVLREHASGPNSVFAQRERQLVLQERKMFLLAQTRAEAERLGRRVDVYVDVVREAMDRQGASVNRAVRSGTLGIALLTLLCLVVATLGVRAVDRMVRSLASITRVMSRLAGGDTEQTMPATSRRDELGALARAFEVFRDNARAIRRMAVDMQKQSQLLESVFESIKDGLSVFDQDGRLVTCNRQYSMLLELPAEVVIVGMSVDAIEARLPPLIDSHPWRTLTDLNAPRQTAPSSFELTYESGKVIEFRSNPMPGGGFVTLASDLTERRMVEFQLRQSQKMEVLGQLTGGVAHDFSNLLTAIMGNLYLLHSLSDLSAPAQRYVARATVAAEQGAALIGRLLVFARRQTLLPQAVEVDGLVRELSDLIEYSVGQGITLLFDFGASEKYAWVDRGQLGNALLNLVLNARDAMPQGGGLSIRTTFDEVKNCICIDVADTGCGIAESVKERVFEPFFTTKSGSSSGLGLSIVYGFIKQSGGDITLSSRVGWGTTFTLWLPRHNAQPKTAPEPASLPAPIPRQTILLVEDDRDVRQALTDLLTMGGHAVVPVASAPEALARLKEVQPTIVLSDVDLGRGGNGVALMREIMARHPALSGILMSGLPAELLASRFGLADDLLLVAKPIRPRALEDALRCALRA